MKCHPLAMPVILALIAIQAGPATAQTAERDALRASNSASGQSSCQTPQFSAAQAGDLVERATFYDGKEVLFEGEAIGDRMARADHAWINILGEGYAIGVWMSAGDSASIDRFGSYASEGDRVAIRGVFHRACPEHGGDMDIHADSVAVVARGKPLARAIPAARLILAPVSLICAVFLYMMWKKREALPSAGKRRRPT